MTLTQHGDCRSQVEPLISSTSRPPGKSEPPATRADVMQYGL